MFLFSVAMGALLRGRSAINTINIITDFIFWVEEYRSLYRGLQSWYRGSLTGRSVRIKASHVYHRYRIFGCKTITCNWYCYARIFFFVPGLFSKYFFSVYHSAPRKFRCFITPVHVLHTYIHIYVIYLILQVIKYRQLIIADVELPNNQIKTNK